MEGHRAICRLWRTHCQRKRPSSSAAPHSHTNKNTSPVWMECPPSWARWMRNPRCTQTNIFREPTIWVKGSSTGSTRRSMARKTNRHKGFSPRRTIRDVFRQSSQSTTESKLQKRHRSKKNTDPTGSTDIESLHYHSPFFHLPLNRFSCYYKFSHLICQPAPPLIPFPFLCYTVRKSKEEWL